MSFTENDFKKAMEDYGLRPKTVKDVLARLKETGRRGAIVMVKFPNGQARYDEGKQIFIDPIPMDSKWTTKLPTQPGYYWHTRGGPTVIRKVEKDRYREGFVGIYLLANPQHWVPIEEFDDAQAGYWCGPLVHPPITDLVPEEM